MKTVYALVLGAVLMPLPAWAQTTAISGARVVPRLDRAMRAGRIPPMIIVMPNALGDEGDAFYGSGFTWLQSEALAEKSSQPGRKTD